MKKFKNYYTLAVLLMAGAAITACTSDDDIVSTQTEVQKTYKMSVTATKGADTRTLTEEDGALSAAWNADDEVVVYNADGDSIGALKPVKAGATKLKGEVSDVEVGDELTLKFLPDASYAKQDGTLEYIDIHCNAAVATVKVTKIDGTDVYTDDATFENQQAITKFTFDKSVSKVVIEGGTTSITVTPNSATKNLYVAMPSAAKRPYAITATTEDGVFMEMRSVALNKGYFYTATITLSNSLIQHWPFDGNANNAISSYNGSVTGATLTADRFGNEDSAYNFDGNDVISISKDAVSFGKTSFSANVWVCSTQTLGYGNILRADDGYSGQGWMLRFNSGRLEIWEGRAYSYSIISEAKYADGNWHMLTYVRDVENLKGIVYCDGEKVGQYTMTDGRINDVTRELYLGAAKNIEYYTGKMDDLRLYGIALSEEAVKSIFDALKE